MEQEGDPPDEVKKTNELPETAPTEFELVPPLVIATLPEGSGSANPSDETLAEESSYNNQTLPAASGDCPLLGEASAGNLCPPVCEIDLALQPPGPEAIADSIRLHLALLKKFFGDHTLSWISKYPNLSDKLSLGHTHEDKPTGKSDEASQTPTTSQQHPHHAVQPKASTSGKLSGVRGQQTTVGSNREVLPGEVPSTSTGGYTKSLKLKKTSLADTEEARQVLSPEVINMLRNLEASVASNTDSDESDGNSPADQPLHKSQKKKKGKPRQDRVLPKSSKHKKGNQQPTRISPEPVLKKTSVPVKKSVVPSKKFIVLTNDDVAGSKAYSVICCPVKTCNDIFVSNQTFLRHLNTHGNIEICPECWKVFPNTHMLEFHSITHMNDKLYQCIFDYCGRRFQQLSELNDHMEIHTTDKPYICPKCQQAFRRIQDIRKHLRCHVGIGLDI